MTFKHSRIFCNIIILGLLLISYAYAAPRIPREVIDNGLVYCANQNNFTLNPSLDRTDLANTNIYNRLISTTDGKTFKPELAKSYSFSNQGKSIIIKLRKDVSFHKTPWFADENKFTADDAIFSLNRFFGLNTPLFEFDKILGFQINEPHLKSIEKIDDYTIKINLTENYPEFLEQLANHNAIMLSLKYAQHLEKEKKLANFYLMPIGTGVYQLNNYVRHQYVRLVKNPDYWGKNANIKNIILDLSSSFEGRLLKFLNNECQIAEAPALSQLKILENSNSDFKISQSNSMNLVYLAFNPNSSSLRNKEVRLAISNAINRQRIVDQLFYGKANIANSFLPKNAWGNKISGDFYNFNPLQAKIILEPLNLNITLWVVRDKSFYNPEPMALANIIKYDLEQAGINVSIEYVSTNYINKNLNTSYDLLLNGIESNTTDPALFLSKLFGYYTNTSFIFNFWTNEKFNLVMNSLISAEQPSNQIQFINEAQKILLDKLPILPLFSANKIFVLNPRVNNFKLNKLGDFSFADLEIKDVKND